MLFFLKLYSYPHFGSGSERNMACSIAILSLFLRSLRTHQCREGRGQMAAQQCLLWRDIQQQGQSLCTEARLQDLWTYRFLLSESYHCNL